MLKIKNWNVMEVKFNKMEELDNLEQNLDKSNEKLHISDVSDSELFTLELSKKEVMMLKSCLSSLYQNRTPAGDVLSFASRLEDKLKDFLKKELIM
jgi:hypothetical protein